MAALLCTRRPIEPAEFLPMLLGTGASLPTAPQEDGTHFANTAQYEQFMALWTRRSDRGGDLAGRAGGHAGRRAQLPPRADGRARRGGRPARGRARRVRGPGAAGLCAGVGAGLHVRGGKLARRLGRRRATRKSPPWIDEALEPSGGPDRRRHRQAHGEHARRRRPAQRERRAPQRVWRGDLGGVRPAPDLAAAWGPRVEPVRKAETPGRNDPCPCGSGKKFKKCHGA